jgi:diguanylate cyclase (GGDEF)-like protein
MTIPGKRILVVEDERIIALDLCGALEELGYFVVGVARSSEEALRKAVEGTPDLVLMDIRLEGDEDGIRTAEALKQLWNVPVVYLSANADSVTIDRALETQPGGYLVKPYNQRSLRTTIEIALRRNQFDLNAQKKLADVTDEKRALEKKSSELEELARRFREDSMLDPLTKLYNRRYLDTVMSRELARSKRENYSVGLVMLDLDHFKMLNDNFGHIAGDNVLQSVGSFIRARLRAYDTACRYGGEEFAVILPGTSLPNSVKVAEQLRLGIAQLRLETNGQPIKAVTASFGVAACPDHGSDTMPLIAAADAALYTAKSEGRNRVVVANAGNR